MHIISFIHQRCMRGTSVKNQSLFLIMVFANVSVTRKTEKKSPRVLQTYTSSRSEQNVTIGSPLQLPFIHYCISLENGSYCGKHKDVLLFRGYFLNFFWISLIENVPLSHPRNSMQSNVSPTRNFNIPPPPSPFRAFELLKIGSFKFLPPRAKMVFKCPTLSSDLSVIPY